MKEFDDAIMQIALSQGREWLQSEDDLTEIWIQLRKTGLPDDFIADYDRDTLGKLMVALTADERLSNVAFLAVLYILSLHGEDEREEFINRIRLLF